MKLAVLDPTDAAELAFLNEFAPAFELVAPQSPSDDLFPLVAGADAILTKRCMVTDDLMAAAGEALKLIQLRSSRRDKVDLAAARARDIPVALMPQVGCIAVAEQAMMLMLGVSKKVVQGHEATVRGAYRERDVEPIRTEERRHKFQWMQLPDIFELNGTTLGLVGFGEIATEVARRARAFGMEVLYWKRERLAPEIEAEEAVAYRDLPQLLSESDIVSLHVPLTPATDCLIDAQALHRMKNDAYLINTCRGGVVDEDALVNALQAGTIKGAGLDVFLYEPIPHDHPLLRLDNVLLAPHMGGGSGGARMKQARDVMMNLVALSEGRPVKHLI